MSTSRVPEGGAFRLQLKSAERKTWVIVGSFPGPSPARRLAEDLVATGTLMAVKVEHKNSGSWKPVWSWIASAGLLLLTLAGCATGGASPREASIAPIPREVGRVPTAEERRIIEAFLPPVLAAARLEGFTCQDVPVAMAELAEDSLRTMARPSRNPCNFYLQVSTVFLRRDSALEHMGTAAHELGHVMDGDWTPQRAQVPQIQREGETDAVAIRIMNHMPPEVCQAAIALNKRIRAEHLRAWGVEQRTTVGTHPSYTERIYVLERDCRGA